MGKIESFVEAKEKPELVRLFYEGRTRLIYETENPSYLVIEYKDLFLLPSGTSGSSLLKISGRGELAAKMTSLVFACLKAKAVRTHFEGLYSSNSILVRRVKPLPFCVVIRRYVGQDLASRLGLPSSLYLKTPICDLRLQESALNDPFVSEEQLLISTGVAPGEISKARKLARKVFSILEVLFEECGFSLYDVKLSFGHLRKKLAIIGDIIPENFTAVDEKTGLTVGTNTSLLSEDVGVKDIIAMYELVLERLQKVLGVRV